MMTRDPRAPDNYDIRSQTRRPAFPAAISALRGLDLSQLAGLGVVGFEAGSAIRQLIDSALRAAGVEMNVVMELRSIPAIVRMVATTGSLGFVSQLGVEEDGEVLDRAGGTERCDLHGEQVRDLD